MSIKVRFFASLAESVGRREIECSHAPGITLREVWRRVNEDRPLPNGVLCAVNLDYGTLDRVLDDDDEVAPVAAASWLLPSSKQEGNGGPERCDRGI